MRRTALTACIVLIAAACSRNESPEVTSGFAPADAPERSSMPAKCKDALTFDNECRELFDRTWGPGAGDNEKANLNLARAHGSKRAYEKSNAKPAPKIGENP